MKNLITYVEQHNASCRAFNYGKVLDARNLSGDDLRLLSDKLKNDLSPENLCCDGELRGIALRRRTKFLAAVVQELIEVSMGKAVPVRELLAA